MKTSRETFHAIGAVNRMSEEKEYKPKVYRCPNCGYEQTFDEAYLDSGKFCPNCDARLDIPLSYWNR